MGCGLLRETHSLDAQSNPTRQATFREAVTCPKLRISWVVCKWDMAQVVGARCHKGQGTPPEADSALGPAPTHICFRAAICPDVAGGQQLAGPHLPSPG